MSRIWRASLDLVFDVAEALAFLPLYARVLIAVVLAAWMVLVADWNEIFRRSSDAVSVETPAAAPAKPKAVAGPPKADDRVAVSGPSADQTGKFVVSDPRVGPDGSISDGENGTPLFLAELKPFSSKDVCTRADGERWACGLHAYATLRNSIAHKTLQCANAGSREDPLISCRMGGENIALILVNKGLVELKDSLQNRELEQAETKARAAKVGIWNRQAQSTKR